MKVPRIRRRWKMTYHLRGGAKISEVVRNLKWTMQSNELTGLERTGAIRLSDYVRLDSIDAITSRKAFSFYIDWE